MANGADCKSVTQKQRGFESHLPVLFYESKGTAVVVVSEDVKQCGIKYWIL